MLSCRILSKESLDALHYATLEVLEKTGVVVESEKETEKPVGILSMTDLARSVTVGISVGE